MEYSDLVDDEDGNEKKNETFFVLVLLVSKDPPLVLAK